MSENSNDYYAAVSAAGLGGLLGSPTGEIGYAVNTLGIRGNKLTRTGLKNKLNPFYKEPIPKTFLQRMAKKINKKTDTVDGITQLQRVLGFVPQRIMKDKKDVVKALHLKKKFLQNRKSSSVYGGLAGLILAGVVGAGIEKKSSENDKNKKRVLVGGTALAGAGLARPAATLYTANKHFNIQGNALTKKKFRSSIRNALSFSSSPKSSGPRMNSKYLEGVKRLLKFAPDEAFKMKGTSKKEVVESIDIIQKFIKANHRAKNVASVTGASIGGLAAALRMEKTAYGISVKGAVGPRKNGIAQVNRSQALPKGEPAGRPIVSKKSMRSFLSKKNKVLPGNLTDIGKLTK
jgi:hypothetical protein